MHIVQCEVLNYKSFQSSGPIPFEKGFNVIVGQNDVGKSALMEALSLRFGSHPHRSLLTMPRPQTQPNVTSSIVLQVHLDASDISDFLSGMRDIRAPYAQEDGEVRGSERFLAAVRAGGRFEFRVDNGEAAGAGHLHGAPGLPTGGYLRFDNVEHPTGLSLQFIGGASQGNLYGPTLTAAISANVIAFKAERMKIGEFSVGPSKNLAPDASNLPQVLNYLISSDRRAYEEYMGHVREVFPHVQSVTVPAVSNSAARIIVSTVPEAARRPDLGVPLSESGTGLSQVLAMLYAVVTADRPKVILIDEPQSFLHPGAVRKLIDILRGYAMHQFIITSHSPSALSATATESMLHIRRDGAHSRVDRIDARNAADVRSFLSDVGARLTDVFGADSVLWVEGKTEEICFPTILSRVGNRPLLGVQVLSLTSTGTLGTKRATETFDIYAKVSGSRSLMPPALAFVLDSELRTDEEKKELISKSKGLARFLPRRMFENYLLEPNVLASVLSGLDSAEGHQYSAKQVEDWFAANGTKQLYVEAPTGVSYGSPEWFRRANGARLLEDLFSVLTAARVQFDKIRHAPLLVAALIDARHSDLRELADFIVGMLDTSARAASK